ncbi:MAG: inositol 2-dehydrogenase [Chloroflexi bacterium]|nr:inositol 2-dehydrogenase [Chloroflexota bacterium]MCI0578837.1 inositol 2-dehydrogenase [Chloroflexota bacterium]MCI0648420.1 inositol 2-dehydrogenase [Chloroflexota bacterium]MCI0727656.1 inositol 2-dehydrogenase [Chloroflexota bacterium]
MPTKQRIRIGVIGAGRIGKIHAESIARRIPEAELAAIADVYLSAAQATADSFPAPLVTADYREVLKEPAIDALAICSATDTHAQIIVEAAAAGKHIFCEKPIDHSLAKIDAALQAVAQAGVKFQVGFNRRFDANFRKVREIVAGGKIGRPHLLRITSRDPAPPPIEYVKVSGGLFLDMTIHDFDMARYLVGSEVEEVYATAGVLVDPAIGEAGDVDTALVTLKFANGVLGTIDNSRQAVYGYDQRVELLGSTGMVTVTNNTPDGHIYSNVEGVHSARPLYFFLERYMESYVAEMKAFVACLVNDTPPPVTGEDGRIPVVMALAAQKSYLENRPVRLSEVTGNR